MLERRERLRVAARLSEDLIKAFVKAKRGQLDVRKRQGEAGDFVTGLCDLTLAIENFLLIYRANAVPVSHIAQVPFLATVRPGTKDSRTFSAFVTHTFIDNAVRSFFARLASKALRGGTILGII